MFSVKFASWAMSSQSFFLYGDGHRGSVPYLLFNLYHPSNGNPTVFIAGRGPGLHIPIVSTIADNTYYNYRLEYTHDNKTYEFFINDISQGTMTATTQTFSIINDLFFYPYTDQSVKDIYVYQGTP